MGKKAVRIENPCRNDRVSCMWVCGAYPSGKKSSNRVGLYGNIWREYNNQDIFQERKMLIQNVMQRLTGQECFHIRGSCSESVKIQKEMKKSTVLI